MDSGVKLDQWGYEIRTFSDACVSTINAFYQQVLSYGRKRSVILEAIVHDKDCVLANILAASFLCSSDSSRSQYHLQAAKSRLEQATLYERAVFDAINCLISVDRDDDIAVELHSKVAGNVFYIEDVPFPIVMKIFNEQLLNEFPKDLVSLKRVQVLCFYMGRPDLSLNLVEQVLPQNLEENYVYSMLAFPLLELNRMEEAEKAAKQGLDINKDDCWAQHALCHVLQYQCSFNEAVSFMKASSASWSSCSSFMLTHNWWHVALCYLEANSPIQNVIEIYDKYIWKELEKDDAVKPEVYLNALGLILRVYVRGEINLVEDRLKMFANDLTDKVNWHIEWHLDLLILWALAHVGELLKAEELLKSLKSRVAKMSEKKRAKMQGGLLLAEALYEYGRGNEEQTLELLGLDFDANHCKIIGASDEQLDVFNEVWYDSLIGAGEATKVIEVIEKRIKARDGIPFLYRLLERGYIQNGRQPEAAIAGEKATYFEVAYFK